MERGCGVLLPISSLPNKYGFGCFSHEAFEFVDFLASINMKYWQILPLGIVDDVGSPYSTISAFAGEPLYIDIEKILSDDEIDFFKLNRFSFQKSLIKTWIKEISPEIKMQEMNVYSQQIKT